MNVALNLLTQLDGEITEIPLEQVPEIIGRLAAAEAALRLRLYSAAPRTPTPEEPDRLLNVKETAALLRQSVDWVYRHRFDLPRVELTGRSLRFSAARLQKFIRRRGV